MFRISSYYDLLFLLQLMYLVLCVNQKPDEARTYYGKELASSDVPFIVGVTVEDLLCTGTIVTDDTVISAAQCFKKHQPSAVKIYAGANQITETGLYFEVKTIHIHPEYKPAPTFSVGEYDVAILKLKRKIPSDLGSPISVSADDWGDDEAPKKCRTAGFGMHKSATVNEKNVGKLHGSIVKVSRNPDSCSCAVMSNAQKKTVICLDSKSGDRLCYGDYGGAPLVCDRKLVGIAHGQVGCPNFSVPFGDIMMCGSDNLVDVFLWVRPMIMFLADYLPNIEIPQSLKNNGDKNIPAAFLLFTTILYQILVYSLFTKIPL